MFAGKKVCNEIFKVFLMLKQRNKFVVRTITTFENFVNSSF